MFESSEIDPQSPSRDSEQERDSTHFSPAATLGESASATGEAAEGGEGNGERDGARGGRSRDPHRGFSLSESDLATEDEDGGVDEDDDVSVATELLGTDDGVDGEGGSVRDGDGGGGHEEGGAGGRGRSAHRRGHSIAANSSSPPSGLSTGSVETKRDGSGSGGGGGANTGAGGSEATGHAAGSTVPAVGGVGVGVSEGVAGAAVVGSKLTPAPSTAAVAASGPGATAREKGWSDPELLMGLVKPEDTPVVTAHDVSRSVGGVEVKRGLLLVCRNTLYFVDGFGREPALVRTSSGSKGATPRSAAAAAAAAAAATAAASAAARSKDPLHGVRRLEEWELGGGAGGIGGGDEDGEAGGAKIQVTLRRKSATNVLVGAAGEGKYGGGGENVAGSAGGEAGTAVTAEQAGGTGCGSGAEVKDEILALGKTGVQRIALDQVKDAARALFSTACDAQRGVVLVVLVCSVLVETVGRGLM